MTENVRLTLKNQHEASTFMAYYQLISDEYVALR